MGSALPLGEPVPADGSLPPGTAIDRRDRRSASTCTCRSAACAAATATSTPTPRPSCAAPARTSTPTRCCARSTSRAAVLERRGRQSPGRDGVLRRRHADAPAARRSRAHARRRPRHVRHRRRRRGDGRGQPRHRDGCRRGRARGIRRHPALDRHAVGRPARPRGTRSHARSRERPHRGRRRRAAPAST